ncbi:MAG: hypothetical protein DRI24_18945, partial [Deltaproteobacteria bacterium]
MDERFRPIGRNDRSGFFAYCQPFNNENQRIYNQKRFGPMMTGGNQMPETRIPVRVAVNVMRARLTVIGFNIAIVSFQITQLPR